VRYITSSYKSSTLPLFQSYTEGTMSDFPGPPPTSPLTNKRTSSSSSSSTYHRSSSSLPPPPNVTPQKQQQQQMQQSYSTGANNNGGSNSNYAQNLARSMTIDEMRTLHRQAMNEAEAKQTELRLVLASRYRELVGSSDEVTKMRERSQELDELVSALPTLMEKLLLESNSSVATTATITADGDDSNTIAVVDNNDDAYNNTVLKLRQHLSNLPRMVHRALDKSNVYEATKSLMELFRLIAEQTDEYPLATALSSSLSSSSSVSTRQDDILLQSQMRMTFLHVQTLPVKITRIAKQILNSAASFSNDDNANAVVLNPKYGAQRSAAALSALDMLTIQQQQQQNSRSSDQPPVELLDLYFDSKAKLLRSLLNQLNTTGANGNKEVRASVTNDHVMGSTNNAEEILSKIVLILQYDIVLHPYQIFILRKFPTINSSISGTNMMVSLPMFPAAIVQAKASNFLSAHLPLIRTKVKSVLVDIAGTTASALGKIRQSLYDKTDGVECTEHLDDSDGICSWDEAVSGVVDVQSVLLSSGIHVGVGGTPVEPSSTVTAMSNGRDRGFSLWAVLFSNTFSSLVHSLLTSSFQSVHTKLVSTLRLSLTNAPPLQSILPHEAYRNTLHIASQLDSALLKVSDDAHELLVHAEERVESERRLRQSLYVQTCEIMGRLICELRRMLLTSDNYDAVKQLIVGRLCHLLKFRLTALSTLLDPNSSPAVLHGGTTGMISIMELSSAYELADDNDDGLITFQEAMEAVDSAFSGTQFHGAEMVRETLLLPAAGRDKDMSLQLSNTVNPKAVTPQDVTLDELTLLLARGLRHENSGRHSALGAIQNSLDRMVESSFQNWAKEVLQPHSIFLSKHTKHFIDVACTSSEEEYQRMFTSSETPSNGESAAIMVTNVSPHITSYLVNISFTLNRSVCPSDSLLPVPFNEYAVAMGVDGAKIPRMIDMIRWALLRQGLEAVACVLDEHVGSALEATTAPAMNNSGPSGIAQLKNDLSFLLACFLDRNQHGFGIEESMDITKKDLQKIMTKTDILFRRSCDMNTTREIERKHEYVLEACDLFISSLFGEDSSSAAPLGTFEETNGVLPRMGSTPLFHPPLASSCRFPLLPIQADRTLSGVQARGKYKEKEENDSRSETVGSGAVRAGFGFLSSMLKTS
jgi:hypothetical protein